LTAANRKKLQKEFTLDEEYYAFEEERTSKRRSRRHDDDDDSEPDEEYVEKPSKKNRNKNKINRSHHVLEEPQEPPVAPIVKPDRPVQQDPEADQVPPSAPVFHSYDISVRQIQQNVFPAAPLAGPGCPAAFAPTTVLAYGPANIAGTPFHNWPGFTIEAQVSPVRRNTMGYMIQQC